MLPFTDQTGHEIHLASMPRRIVSLVPSQTELLFDLGLHDETVGITKFCVHPQQWFHQKQRVGGTKQINHEIIHALKPDLIIANKEENQKEDIELLLKDYPVWTSDVHNIEDAYEMIMQIAVMTGKGRTAMLLIDKIRKNFLKIQLPQASLKTAYLIWQEPYMTVGGDTFIHSMMRAAGFENIFGARERYPETGIEELQECQLVLLSSEPFPFKQKHIDELRPLLPGTKVMLVDGEMFSWYGSRMQHAPAYFSKLHNSSIPNSQSLIPNLRTNEFH